MNYPTGSKLPPFEQGRLPFTNHCNFNLLHSVKDTADILYIFTEQVKW